ncbi:VPLPA-CTERM sorting domain-containing protein [Actibacterium ureilyticum]|uniref:VPLPA-CTERM sorting domain-containing protein n=1 Tax=Actibacterium ureilyticum TaxID=1590614 RepID=UPI000BAB0B89|nr:VPLPA-CTERM sorting domain-containing protein [Actibacterium ureilyticum]
MRKGFAALALAAGMIFGGLSAQAATLAIGESVDFEVDTSALGAFTINRYGMSCTDPALCGLGSDPGGTLLDQGNSLSVAGGTIRGGSDLFNLTFTGRFSDVDAFSAPVAGGAAVAAGQASVFLRITAVDQALNISGANISSYDLGVFRGVELSPVPLPAGGALLCGALAGLAFVRRKRA